MKRDLNRMKEAAPLYAQVANDLRYKIQMDEWAINQRIPSELELCKSYKVSRITIRKAIDELVREGLLYRKRPSGTFVLDWENEKEEEHTTRIKTFTREMEELGEKAVTLSAEVSLIPADRRLAKFLNVEVGSDILMLKRIRGTKNHAFAFFLTYIPYNHQYSLNDNDYYESLYAYLQNLGIFVTTQREYIEAIKPPLEVRKALNISENEPVLKRVRMVSLDERQYWEYSECFYIGSDYRYYVDFQ